MYAGNPEPYIDMWTRNDPVNLFAWRPCKTGWDDLGRPYRWVGSRFSGGQLSYPLEVLHVGTDLAYTVGYQQGRCASTGEPPALSRSGSLISTAASKTSGNSSTVTATSHPPTIAPPASNARSCWRSVRDDLHARIEAVGTPADRARPAGRATVSCSYAAHRFDDPYPLNCEFCMPARSNRPGGLCCAHQGVLRRVAGAGARRRPSAVVPGCCLSRAPGDKWNCRWRHLPARRVCRRVPVRYWVSGSVSGT